LNLSVCFSKADPPAYLSGGQLGRLDKGSILVSTLVLAALTKRYIEDPFRSGRKGSPWFAQRMRAALADMVAPHFPPPEADGAVPGLLPAVLSSMFAASITWWLEGGRPVPPREIAARSAELASAVIAQAGGSQAATRRWAEQ
jgi:hypothetical protein